MIFILLFNQVLLSKPNESDEFLTIIENIMKIRILNYNLNKYGHHLNFENFYKNDKDSVLKIKDDNYFSNLYIDKSDIVLKIIENKDYFECYNDVRLFTCFHEKTIVKKDSIYTYADIYCCNIFYFIAITKENKYYILDDEEKPEFDTFIKDYYHKINSEEQAQCVAKLAMLVNNFIFYSYNLKFIGYFQNDNKIYYEYEIWKYNDEIRIDEQEKILSWNLKIYMDCKIELKKIYR